MVRPHTLHDVTLTGLRGLVARLVESQSFVRFITAIILINAVTLGLETDAGIMANYGQYLLIFDKIALAIFVCEIVLKLFIYRLSFFRDGWNIFDFIIVGIALIPAVGPLAVLRALRVLRVLRLLTVVPSMRRVISALFIAIPGIASVLSVLLIIYYVAAVLAAKLFSGHPVPEIAAKFESISASMYTLFQIMTLESWSQGIVRPVMDAYPYAWLFFIPFIIITSFAVLNLFIGIIVDAMNIVHDEEDNEKKSLKQQLAEIRHDIHDIKAMLEKKD